MNKDKEEMMNKKVPKGTKVNEKTLRKAEIDSRFQLIKSLRGYAFFMVVVFILGSICAWWGFTRIDKKPLPTISVTTHMIVAWVSVAVAAIGFITLTFLFYVLLNAKKHTKRQLDAYNQEYPDEKYSIDGLI